MKGRYSFGLMISLTILCTCYEAVFPQSRQTSQGLDDSSYPTNTQAQSTRITIQSLPDGEYLYGRVIDPKQPEKRVIFRKIGNRVIAVTYNYGKTECCEGILNRNTITNTIFPTYSRDGKLFFIGGGLNYFNIFYSLHPELSGRKIKFSETEYMREWQAIEIVVANNLTYQMGCTGRGWGLSEYDRTNVRTGERLLTSTVLDKVADAVFYTRHPALGYRKIQPGEYKLTNEWMKIRQAIWTLPWC